MKGTKKRNHEMKIKMRVSSRMSLRFQIVQRMSLIMILAIIPFTMERFFSSENALAHTISAKKTVDNHVKKAEVENSKNEPETSSHSANKLEIASISALDAISNGILYISPNTIFATEGSFTTSSIGSTTNKGDFYVKGDWVNNGNYAVSTGKISFWGGNSQNINGTSSTEFYNAEVNKTSNGVTLNNAITVDNVLTLTQGMVDLNSNKLTISNSATSALSYTTGYLLSEKTNNSSKVQWNIGSTTGSHVIPFATASAIAIPLTLNLTSGTIGNITTSTFPVGADNQPYPTSPDSVHNMNGAGGVDNSANVVDRFWQIDRTGTSGVLTVTFTYADTEVPANGESNLVAQRFSNSAGWETPLSSQIFNSALNTVTTSGITGPGVYALTQSSYTLPIKLLFFKASLNPDNQAELNWATATEKNNDFFTIERSKDLKDIETLTEVKGAGTSYTPKNYKIIDEHPFEGTSYYRLKQTDFDGKFEYFNWCAVSGSKTTKEEKLHIEKLFPNPFSDQFIVNYIDPISEEITIQLIDQSGRIVFADHKNSDQGINTYAFYNNIGLIPGNYILILSSKNQKDSIKIIRNN